MLNFWHNFLRAIARNCGRCLPLALLFAGVSLRAQTNTPPVVKPEEARALLLVQFAELTTWPKGAREGGNGKLIIGFFRAPELFAATAKVVDGSVGRYELREVSEPAEALQCHVLYFRRTDGGARNLLKAVADKPILTVGEEEAFVRSDGILGFKLVEAAGVARPRYFVNIDAMDRAKVRLDSRVLGRALSWRKEQP